MRALGIALIAAGTIYLTAVAVWTGGFPPFWRRDARRRGQEVERDLQSEQLNDAR